MMNDDKREWNYPEITDAEMDAAIERILNGTSALRNLDKMMEDVQQMFLEEASRPDDDDNGGE